MPHSRQVTARLALGAIALTSLAFAGCSASGSSGAPGAGGPQLVIARVKDAVGLDPSHETDGLSLNITSEVFQNLVTFKPGTFQIQPSIADSWSSSPDGKTWTFKLKAGLQFSDGTPLDASAVKFNFDRWRLKDHPSHGSYNYTYWASQFGGFPGLVVDVQAPSATQVVMKLKAPLGPFLRNLAMPSFAIGSPTAIKKDAAGFGSRPVGSGPYTIAEWIRDDHLTLVANPKWNGPKPAYGTVIVRDIPDQATSVLSLQKGDIDVLLDPRPEDAKNLGRQAGITIYRQPSNNVSYLALNLDKKPFDQLLVRQAISYAIDIPGIAKGFYAGGALPADNWTPPGMLGENPTVKANPRDPAKAKALLRQAGFPNGFSTQLWVMTAPRPYMPEPQRVAEAIQANLRAIGVNAEIAPFEWAVYLPKIRNGEHPMCLIGWTGDNGDPDNFLYTLFDKDSAVKGNAQNYSFWRDEKFHALMLAGQQSVDESKRRSIYMQANAMVHDQAPAVALVHTTVPFAAKSSIAGIIPRPDSILNFELFKPKAP